MPDAVATQHRPPSISVTSGHTCCQTMVLPRLGEHETQTANTLTASGIAAGLRTCLHVQQLGWLLQVMFMRELMDVLRSPPGHLKLPARRGTFFNRLDPTRPSTGSLPKLLRRWACPLLCRAWVDPSPQQAVDGASFTGSLLQLQQSSVCFPDVPAGAARPGVPSRAGRPYTSQGHSPVPAVFQQHSGCELLAGFS